ncbi:MAG: hypothetical protein H7Y38_11140, partial [Armatimonadetes bacterium]|nr:hypothetical protein [Armatimonadota bacterium]
MPEITHLSATEIADAVRTGSLSARDVCDAHLLRLEETDPGDDGVHAYLHVTAGAARAAADKIDAARAHGETLPPLAGVPVAVKDNPNADYVKMVKTEAKCSLCH